MLDIQAEPAKHDYWLVWTQRL